MTPKKQIAISPARSKRTNAIKLYALEIVGTITVSKRLSNKALDKYRNELVDHVLEFMDARDNGLYGVFKVVEADENGEPLK